jgi:Xaa-Pro aminopeptidase
MNNRLEKLRALIAREGLDCLVISQPENRRYISGFSGSAGVLLVSAEKALILADFRYYTQAARQAPAFELHPVTSRTETTLGEAVRQYGWHKLGIEKHDVTLEAYETWRQAAPDVEWVPTKGLVESLRQNKDAQEIALLREAVRISDEAMQHMWGWLQPGVTEKDVAWELEQYMRTHGAEGLSFNTIVGSGVNSALPHAVLTDRPIQVGDPLVVDMGALYEGYHADITRSFCLHSATDEYLRIWHTVLEAQLAVEKALKAGLGGYETDRIARDLIYAAGYEGKFGHGLGHSVGLAIHEDPRASALSQDVFTAGVVLTVEPGIYLPELGGVRIEDMVVITATGCDVLTQCPKLPVIG